MKRFTSSARNVLLAPGIVVLKKFTCLVAFSYIFLLTAASATTNDVDLVGTRISIDIPGYDRTEGPLTPVSMTQLDDGTLLIANYRNIYALDLDAGKARPVLLDTRLPLWAPTGLHYSRKLGFLFIANYVGNDILIASVARDNDKISLKLIDRLTEGTAIDGPEGISISPDGRYLAIANYDGASISLFEQVGRAWKHRWTTPLVVAHGVTIIGGYVYGSGNSIAKIDIKTGAVVATTKTIGDRPVSFVTCLNPDERSGGLIGADTIGGVVFTADENLKTTSQFGANGPTHINFSMPYCAYWIAGATYILSTYQDRIIVLESGGTRSIEFYADERWTYAKPATDYRMQPDDWKMATVEATLFGKRINPEYGNVATNDGMAFLMPVSNYTFSANRPFYSTTIASDGDWTMITSLSTPNVILANERTGALGSAETREWNCWARGAYILCPSRKYSAEDLLTHAKIVEPSANLSDVAAGLRVELSAMSKEFPSRGARPLLSSLLRNDPPAVKRIAAQQYIEWAHGRAVPLFEYWMALNVMRAGEPR